MNVQKLRNSFLKSLVAGACCSFAYVAYGSCKEFDLPQNFTYLGIDYASPEKKIVLGRCRSNEPSDYKTKCFSLKDGKVSVFEIPKTIGDFFVIKGCNKDGSIIYISDIRRVESDQIIPVYLKKQTESISSDVLRSSLNGFESTDSKENFSCCPENSGLSEVLLKLMEYKLIRTLKDKNETPFAYLLEKNNMHYVLKIADIMFWKTIQKSSCNLIKGPKNGASLFVDTHEGSINIEPIEYSSLSRTKNREIFLCTPEKTEVVLTRKDVLGYLGDELYEDVWYPCFSYGDKFLFAWYRSNQSYESSPSNHGIKYFVKVVGGDLITVQEFLQQEAEVGDIKLIHDLFLLNDTQTIAILATNNKEKTKLYLLNSDKS